MINEPEENELEPELLGMHAMNFSAKHNSSSRGVMFASHFSQRLVTMFMDEKRILTGVEQEFGKYTFSIKMPADGQIIQVIQRYPQGIEQGSLNFNPETIVVYENDQTKEIDHFTIPNYASFHQFFGFKYEFCNENLSLLRPGKAIAKGTTFADSPGATPNTGYKYGNNFNVAFMSIPSVSEDGVMICDDVLPRMAFRIYERRIAECGAGQFPLNLHGTPTRYQPLPEIGDMIREDGLLAMFRTYDPDLAPVEMSIYDTMEPDFIFDKGVYARGGQGRVVDIKVISNNNPSRMLPPVMAEQFEKYWKALLKYHQTIIDVETRLKYERKRKFGEAKLKLSPKLHRLIVESLAVTNYNATKMKHSLNLLFRKAPIDEYRVEMVIEYVMIPTVGYKISDHHGGKGVIVKIEKRENMPMDQDGNSADIVMDSASIISRMNVGRLYEHYLGSAIRDVAKRIRLQLGVAEKITQAKVKQLNPEAFEKAYAYLLHFYNLVCVKQYDFFNTGVSHEERYEHMTDVLNDGIYLYYPINNRKSSVQIIKDIQRDFQPTYGPVTYVGDSGKRVTTTSKVRIAPLYIMLLDKIADDWSAVSSGKLQHFGVLSPMTKSEKFSYPYRNSPVRTIGETEGRIFAGYCGREAIAEMIDRSNSPYTQRNMYWNILTAPVPSNIDYVVDRNYVKLGASRPLGLIRHMFGIAGFALVYESEAPRTPYHDNRVAVQPILETK